MMFPYYHTRRVACDWIFDESLLRTKLALHSSWSILTTFLTLYTLLVFVWRQKRDVLIAAVFNMRTG